MKKYTAISIFLLAGLMYVSSCKQDMIELQPPPTPVVPTPETPSQGTADLKDPIFIGTSYMAGFQAGALFTDGQNNSLAAIIRNTLTTATLSSGPSDFQPSINATLGYNIFITPNPGSDQRVIGRMLLQGADPVPTPQKYAVGALEAVPNPQVNPGFMYTGTKANLRNFSVEAITLGQFLIPNTGNWADPNPLHGFSPFYARFASAPGTSKIISDAIAVNGSFAFVWVGMDDFMLYAANGGDFKAAPLNSSAAFAGQFGAFIGALFTGNPINPNLKGVIGNFPDIFVMPHFTSVPYNPIPMDAPTAAGVNAELSANYNLFLQGMVANHIISSDEATKRTLNFAAGQNAALIADTDLTNLAPYMAGPYAGLLPYARARQTTSSDIMPLSAGSILGTLAGDGTNPNLIYGVTVPLPDKYVIVPSERDSIINARTAFNATIASTVSASGGKLVLADVSKDMASLITNAGGILNNVVITPNINPPTGIYSEDGLHPNTRGYAFIANSFISAINVGFGAKVPLTDLSKYPATALPIP